MSTLQDPIALAGWRRAIAEMYIRVREISQRDPNLAWQDFRLARDQLFKSHPSTPLNPQQRQSFTCLSYYPYDPAWRLVGKIDYQVSRESFRLDLAADDFLQITRIARVSFTWSGGDVPLSLYWLEGYAGGLFLPFRDATNGTETYGGGRYLYDTIKGADLGVQNNQMVLDFNFAYNPSCAYNDRWACPLPPRENQISFPVAAGEKIFSPQPVF